MEDDENEQQQQQPSTPFWHQNTTFQPSSNLSLGTFSSILFNSTSVILLLLVAAALIFMFLFIPSILNFTSQIFRPNSVKRSWDSLNLVLILFAIICAFLGRTNDNNENPNSGASGRFRSPSPSLSYKYREREQGYGEYSDRMTRLRSRSSYPDLRQHDYTVSPISPWVSADYIDRSSNRVANAAYRFSDDTQLRGYQFSDSGWKISTKLPPATEDRSIETEDDIIVENPNTVEALPQRLATQPSNPPPPPQLPFNPLLEIPTRVKPKSKRTYRAVERTEEALEKTNPTSLLPPSSPPRTATVRRKPKRIHRSFDDAFETRDEDQLQKPPYPPPHTAESDLTEKKKSGPTMDFLASFYGNQKRKKKRERQRSSENFDHIISSTNTSAPPQPPAVFHNLFSSKKSKGKKSASDHPESITSKSRFTKPNTTKIALAQPPIPIPTSTTKFTSYNISRGNESPLYGIPEPPPLPPFGMPVWKFVVQGDYVRLKSMNSSRSGSPDPEYDRDDSNRDSSGNGENMRSEMDDEEGGDSSASAPAPEMFCPSPDVNAKADNFIARFRAELKMEKVNSGKGVGLSRLGPNANINNHG